MGPYIVDFICLEKKLIVELDGDQHGHGAQQAHDENRDRWLESRGYHVVRYWNNDIYSNLGRVLDDLLEYLRMPGDAAPPP